MTGGLLNLIAYGNQNVILNGNPTKSFFKTSYSKYTNFGLQKYFDQKITSAVNNSYEVAKNYIEESKRSVEADIFLISLDLNKY